jgi:hypothetical protein
VTPTPEQHIAAALESHQFTGLVDASWTSCLCGWTAQQDQDDDDGSFARHEAAVLAPLVETLLADARTDGFRHGYTAGRTLTREHLS